eukprot:CAMPEP_0175933538 /NCGR_PEP_ID=MMETSP0108-20121206/19984_1 /TAXON_ID=195067 ORGANISM="Goniomonas pacifica, Strain CCMP1869" /NCGR_SAMPLE_ID=MMETSP0108 /ASSEMBLY_ACC=CAM_ASM_000204 /LENGTH=347 /DNA_ID=CAMNT_0017257265 /DNA_START=9 /DNA_END=1052 /DNA_ORIENTATION=-
MASQLDSTGVSVGLAGVGIFFQQDPTSQLVFVKTIVPGGSADRSKQVFVGDVVVKVDGQDVQGQPLHVLRTLILGRQGDFATLEFRRRDGSIHTVPLMRGAPEYFESLERNEPLQNEIELLRREVVELGRRHNADQEEIARLRGAVDGQGSEAGRRLRGMEDNLTAKDAEIVRLTEALRAAENARRHVETQMSEMQRREVPMMEDLRRFEEKERLRLDYIEELKRRMDDEKARIEAHVRRIEQENNNERMRREDAEQREAKLVDELKKRLEEDRIRRERDADLKRRFDVERKGIKEAHRINESIAHLLRETEPRLTALERDMFGGQPAGPPLSHAPPAGAPSNLYAA